MIIKTEIWTWSWHHKVWILWTGWRKVTLKSPPSPSYPIIWTSISSTFFKICLKREKMDFTLQHQVFDEIHKNSELHFDRFFLVFTGKSNTKTKNIPFSLCFRLKYSYLGWYFVKSIFNNTKIYYLQWKINNFSPKSSTLWWQAHAKIRASFR